MFLEWNLREEILEIAHSWLAIFIAFLVGSLLGWAVSYILPAPYRAESVLYVAYNADAVYRNPDDYKNWQLSELEIFIVSEPVLDATLKRLQAQDSYWQDLTTGDIRNNIHAYWRNAGKWRLVAEMKEPERAKQLVQAWQASVVEQVGESTSNAVIMLDLSAQIGALAAEKASLELRADEITGVKDALLTWRNEIRGADGTVPLSTLDRWHLQAIMASSTSLNPVMLSLIDQFPSSEAPSYKYINWIDQMISLLESELAVIEKRYGQIDLHGEELERKLNEASDASHELTAFLVVEPAFDDLPGVQRVRMSGQMALIGGFLGVLLWGIVWLGRPVRRARS